MNVELINEEKIIILSKIEGKINNEIEELKKLNGELILSYLKENYNSNIVDFVQSLKENFLFIINYFKKHNQKLNQLLNNSEKQIATLNDLTNKFKNSSEYIQKQLDETLVQLENLQKENIELNNKLNFLEKEAQYHKNKREEKAKKSEKLRNAKKKPKRDVLEFEEFINLLNMIDNDNYCNLRRKAAFLILYTTGLRVSNLLLFKVQNIKELMAAGKTRIDLIKGGNAQHLIVLNNESYKLLNQYYNIFYGIFNNKSDDHFFFTSLNNSSKPLDMTNFNKELNLILKKISTKLDKNIRTHSFRTTVINKLLKEIPIHTVRDLVGHKVIASTEIYYRSNITYDEAKNMLDKVDNYRFK